MEQFWRDNHFSVRWQKIPEAARWRGEWKKFLRLPPDDPRRKTLRYLFIWHHRNEEGDLGNLGVSARLTYLELLSSNARTIGALPAGLRRLELHRCIKLESARGLAASCPELRYLHVNNSRKFHDLAELLKLKKLEVLCLNSCGDLPNLEFLARFPHLRDFRFVNTNVVDGDLSPLLSLPKLEYAGTLDKAHYSHSVAEIDQAIASKSRSAVRRRKT
jgi:hypothetical protein